MYGLTVRWSLPDSPAGAGPEDLESRLREYVVGSSLERFSGMPGLSFKTWRMRPGEWFEGCYVWATAGQRDAFRDSFAAGAASSPVSQLVGAGPVLIEEFEVVAVAEGGSGFAAGPGPGQL